MITATKSKYTVALAILACSLTCATVDAAPIVARNGTVPTLCAEHDNISVGLAAPDSYRITSFSFAMSHPTYEWTVDHTAPDFSNCQPTEEPVYDFTPATRGVPGTGAAGIVAVTEPQWWLPTGMTVIANDTAIEDVHYIAMHREMYPGHWPQVLVIYADGNIRAKPFAPAGVFDTIFGSSFIIGPVEQSTRPFAAIKSLQYIPATDSLNIIYANEQTATLTIDEITRDVLRINVDVSGLTLEPGQRFANLRSMIVNEGNADADHMAWVDDAGVEHDDPILDFAGGLGSEFFLYRETLSIHNTSAPDILVGDFEVEPLVALVPGDTNGNRIVDYLDYNNLIAQFGGTPGVESADFNGDKRVDLVDFAILRDNFGTGIGPGSPSNAIGAPEPTTLSLLALGCLSLIRRRRLPTGNYKARRCGTDSSDRLNCKTCDN